MQKETEDKRQRLLAALKIGEDDIAAGRTTPYSRELMDELYQEAMERVRNGGK